VQPHNYDALPLLPSSDHRAVALSVTIPASSSEEGDEDDLRNSPPFTLSVDTKARRVAARRLEIMVGIAAYLVLTPEGYAILVGLFGGGLIGYVLLRALI